MSYEALPGMTDITSVFAEARLSDIEYICNVAKAYGCAATMVNPCYLNFTFKNLIGYDSILKDAAICFPLGCDLTSVKVYSAKQAEIMGAQEIDMMMNVSAFLSGNLKYTKHDIDAVCDSVKVPVKVVIEASLLNDKEIASAAELVAKTKAAYGKTNTGFYDKPTTMDTIRIIKDAVGDSIKIKASGGIRSKEAMLEMAEMGVSRFGIRGPAAHAIFKDMTRRLKNHPRDRRPLTPKINAYEQRGANAPLLCCRQTSLRGFIRGRDPLIYLDIAVMSTA
jgi:deoxyribose-phosphate aldolase